MGRALNDDLGDLLNHLTNQDILVANGERDHSDSDGLESRTMCNLERVDGTRFFRFLVVGLIRYCLTVRLGGVAVLSSGTSFMSAPATART